MCLYTSLPDVCGCHAVQGYIDPARPLAVVRLFEKLSCRVGSAIVLELTRVDLRAKRLQKQTSTLLAAKL